MANIRFDNFTDDAVTVFLDGEKYDIADGERVTAEMVEKGSHQIRVHRSRIPMESEDIHKTDATDFEGNFRREEQSLHTQLDGVFTVEINSAKAVVTLKTKVREDSRLGMDTLFSGYEILTSGAKVTDSKEIFAGKSVKKKYVSHQLREAFLPVGFIGIALLFMGLAALTANLKGGTVNLGGMDLKLPLTIILLAVSVGMIGYSIFVIVRSLKVAKKFHN